MMNNVLLSLVGVLLCTGPLWGIGIGYVIARKGWTLRSPFFLRGEEDDA